MNARQEITGIFIGELTSRLVITPGKQEETPRLLLIMQRWLERLRSWLGGTPCLQEVSSRWREATKSKLLIIRCKQEITLRQQEEVKSKPEGTSRY